MTGCAPVRDECTDQTPCSTCPPQTSRAHAGMEVTAGSVEGEAAGPAVTPREDRP